MNRIKSMGLLVSILLLLGSCSKEDVMNESSQVINHEVNISFFEKSIEDFSTVSDYSSARLHSTRADKATSLPACHRFSELEVALIPIESENDSGYVIRQDSLDENFGKVSFDIPAGSYHMVAIAAKTEMPFTDRISIKSISEARFANNKVTDMVYAYKDIVVSSEQSNQSFDASLTRGVSAFVLSSTINTPVNIASETIELTGGCGVVFNPSTGKCKSEETVVYNVSLNSPKYKFYRLFFTVYTLLTDDDVENIHAKSQAKDKNGKVIKECNFTDVHLVKGKQTCYEGNFFDNTSSSSFTVSGASLDDSGFSKHF
jgi:hypothetical protein